MNDVRFVEKVQRKKDLRKSTNDKLLGEGTISLDPL